MAVSRGRRLGEFDLIDRYFRPLATDPGAFGLSDDAALYTPQADEDLVLKTDLIAAGVHFFADDPPGSIAQKALAREPLRPCRQGREPGRLSPVARASARLDRRLDRTFRARPQGRPGALRHHASRRRHHPRLGRPDHIRHRPRPRPEGRDGAPLGAHRPGDVIFVSGTIGDAALGLRVRYGTIDPKPAGRGVKHLLDRYLHPQPRMALAPLLRRYATSAMDVSDGLVGDFAHICDASGVGGDIDALAVPLVAPPRAPRRGRPERARRRC